MKKVFLILSLFISLFSFCQKIKDKDGVVSVDKVDFIKFREDKVSKFCYILSNLKGDDLLYVRGTSYNDPALVKPNGNGGYTNGDVWYFEVLSANLETIYFETHMSGSPFNSFRLKYVVISLFNGEVLNNDGTLNIEKLEMLSKKIGFEYSGKREDIKSAQQGTNTIIIKEEPRKPGININIGG